MRVAVGRRKVVSGFHGRGYPVGSKTHAGGLKWATQKGLTGH